MQFRSRSSVLWLRPELCVKKLNSHDKSCTVDSEASQYRNDLCRTVVSASCIYTSKKVASLLLLVFSLLLNSSVNVKNCCRRSYMYDVVCII